MISTYQAQHGGTVFHTTLNRRQRAARKRLMALVVITAVAASAGVVQAFQARLSPAHALASAYSMP